MHPQADICNISDSTFNRNLEEDFFSPAFKPLHNGPNSPNNFQLNPNTYVSFNLPTQSSTKTRKPLLIPKSAFNETKSKWSENFLKTKEIYTNSNRMALNRIALQKGYGSGKKYRPNSVQAANNKQPGSTLVIEGYLEQGYKDFKNKDTIKAMFSTMLAKKAIDDNLRNGVKMSYETLFVTYYNLTAIQFK